MFLPPLPPKRSASMQRHFSDAFVMQRQHQLDLWLQYVTSHPWLLAQRPLAVFCCGSKAAVPAAWLNIINAAKTHPHFPLTSAPHFSSGAVATAGRVAVAEAAAAPNNPMIGSGATGAGMATRDMTRNQMLAVGSRLVEDDLRRTATEVTTLQPLLERCFESVRRLRDAFVESAAADHSFAATLGAAINLNGTSSSAFPSPSPNGGFTAFSNSTGAQAVSYSWDWDIERPLFAAAGLGLMGSFASRSACGTAIACHAVEPLRFHGHPGDGCLVAAQQGVDKARKLRPPVAPSTAASSSSSPLDGGGSSSGEAAVASTSAAVQREWRFMGVLRGSALSMGLSDAARKMTASCSEERRAWEAALELLEAPLPDGVS